MGKRTKKQTSGSQVGVESPAASNSPARVAKATSAHSKSNNSRPSTPSTPSKMASKSTKATVTPNTKSIISSSAKSPAPAASSPNAVTGLVSANSKRPSVALTEHVVLTRTKANALNEVTQLNVWGNQLDDISIVSKLPNLAVLSVSFNRISSLAPLAQCTQLQELYARHNSIGKPLIEQRGMTPSEALKAELKHLAKCTKLTTLWLCENPCADAVGHDEQKEYRLAVVRAVPSLKRLDDIVVSAAERTAAAAGAPTTNNKPIVSTSNVAASPKNTARPPTPLASSPSTTAHSAGRGRSSTRRSGPAGQLEVVTASPTTPVAAAPFSPQDVRSVIPPEIPVVHGSHASHGLAPTSPRSRSVSNTRAPLNENAPPSPGGESFSVQDVRRVIPPSVPVYTSASARHLGEHHHEHAHAAGHLHGHSHAEQHLHQQARASHSASSSRSPTRRSKSAAANNNNVAGATTGLRPVSETHANWAANNSNPQQHQQEYVRRPSSTARMAWTAAQPVGAQQSRPAQTKVQVHERNGDDHSNNVLFAVLSLVKELDEKELAIVERQVKNARVGSHANGRQAAM